MGVLGEGCCTRHAAIYTRKGLLPSALRRPLVVLRVYDPSCWDRAAKHSGWGCRVSLV